MYNINRLSLFFFFEAQRTSNVSAIWQLGETRGGKASFLVVTLQLRPGGVGEVSLRIFAVGLIFDIALKTFPKSVDITVVAANPPQLS